VLDHQISSLIANSDIFEINELFETN